MQNTFEPIVRLASLLKTERTQLAVCGPNFCIVHRFWRPHTLCTPGEAIAAAFLWHRQQKICLPFGYRTSLLFDYLARHKRFAQSATQIAAGMSIDPFIRRHGAYAGAKKRLNNSVSRTTIKTQIMRLRTGLQWGFRQAKLNLDAFHVLISEETTVNEVRYQLKASVSWEHSEY